MVRSRGSYSRTRVIAVVERATSAGSTGPAIIRFDEAPLSAMVHFREAAVASVSANSLVLRGKVGAGCNTTCADFSLSGKPLLYAAHRSARKTTHVPWPR